jgi:hypothetical protein
MFSVKNFTANISDVPPAWIFETYLGLKSPLTGQSVRTHSIFNPNDKNPSMYLYYNRDTGSYRYKCFSTGKSGSAVDLMMHIWNLSFIESAQRILDDYGSYTKGGNTFVPKIVEHAKWKIHNVITRGWNTIDAEFWPAFNINSDILRNHNVVPIVEYTMQKRKGDIVEEEFTVRTKQIYGYHTDEGVLYKIYQPKNKDRKFIKLESYMQGSDQLLGHDNLIIASSLKDLMAMKSLGIRADIIAADSENTIIPAETINKYKNDYKRIVTIMDSDEPGIKAMKTYRDLYQLPFVYIPLEKDISDVIKIHGKSKAVYELVPKLNQAFEKYEALQLV